MDHDHLISRIEAYCARYRISETTFGNRAINSGKFVPRLRAGGSLTLKTLQRLDRFMMEPTPTGRQPEVASSAP